jgi:hypothetical protein
MAYVNAGSPGVYPSSGSIPSDPGAYSSWMSSQFGPNWGQATADFGTGSQNRYGPQYQPGLTPGAPLPANLGGGGKPWQNPSSWDPRSILNSPNFQRLSGFNGMGPSQQARSDISPAMAWMNQKLSTNDPLGTAGAKNLVEQRGLAALRQGGQNARTSLENQFGGVNSMASPEGMALARSLLQQNEAGGIGGVNQAAQEAGIQERAATGAFQSGVASSLGNLGLGLGGLATQGQGQQLGAAESAAGLESSANLDWANLMGQLLNNQLFGRGWSPAKNVSLARSAQDYQYGQAGGQPQTEPYPYPGAPGTFQGGQNADPFALFGAMQNADAGAGPDSGSYYSPSNPWGTTGVSSGPDLSKYNYGGPPAVWNQGGTGW